MDLYLYITSDMCNENYCNAELIYGDFTSLPLSAFPVVSRKTFNNATSNLMKFQDRKLKCQESHVPELKR